MASHIQGERRLDSEHRRNLLQIGIDGVCQVAVGTPLIATCGSDDGKQVVGTIFGIFFQDTAHFLCPAYDELLPGLAAAVGHIAVF